MAKPPMLTTTWFVLVACSLLTTAAHAQTCTPSLPCDAGCYASSDASVCRPCPAGTYSTMTGLTSIDDCIPCEAGTFSDIEGLASPCSPCPPGTAWEADVPACAPCWEGTKWTLLDGLPACVTCVSLGMLPVQGLSGYPGEVAGTSCELCPSGQTLDPKTMECADCVGGRAPADTMCVSCPDGFGAVSAAVSGESRFVSTDDDTTPGVGCEPCPLGHESRRDAHDVNHCVPCDPGTFRNETMPSCAPCPLGTVDESRVRCRACNATAGEYNALQRGGLVQCGLCRSPVQVSAVSLTGLRRSRNLVPSTVDMQHVVSTGCFSHTGSSVVVEVRPQLSSPSAFLAVAGVTVRNGSVPCGPGVDLATAPPVDILEWRGTGFQDCGAAGQVAGGRFGFNGTVPDAIHVTIPTSPASLYAAVSVEVTVLALGEWSPADSYRVFVAGVQVGTVPIRQDGSAPQVVAASPRLDLCERGNLVEMALLPADPVYTPAEFEAAYPCALCDTGWFVDSTRPLECSPCANGTITVPDDGLVAGLGDWGSCRPCSGDSSAASPFTRGYTPPGTNECHACEAGEEEYLRSSCVSCPEGFGSERDEVCRRCLFGEEVAYNGPCETCPSHEGVSCNGTHVAFATGLWCDSDYFASDDPDEPPGFNADFPVYDCLTPSACPLNTSQFFQCDACARGHKGVLCGQCIDDYALDGDTYVCVRCARESQQWAVLIVFPLLFILVLGWVVWRQHRNMKAVHKDVNSNDATTKQNREDGIFWPHGPNAIEADNKTAAIRVLLNFISVRSILAQQQLGFRSFSPFFFVETLFGITNSNPGDPLAVVVSPLKCLFNATFKHVMLLVVIAESLWMAPLLMAVFIMICACSGTCLMDTRFGVEGVAVVVYFFILNPTLRVLLLGVQEHSESIHTVRARHGSTFLKADFSVSNTPGVTGLHYLKTVQALAVVGMAALFITSMFFLVRMWHWRHHKVSPAVPPLWASRFGFLAAGFRPSRWGWEFVVIIRRVLLQALVTLNTFADSTTSQAQVVWAVLAVALVLESMFHPIASATVQFAEVVSLASMLLSQSAGIILGGNDRWQQALMAVNSVMTYAVTIFLVYTWVASPPHTDSLSSDKEKQTQAQAEAKATTQEDARVLHTVTPGPPSGAVSTSSPV